MQSCQVLEICEVSSSNCAQNKTENNLNWIDLQLNVHI